MNKTITIVLIAISCVLVGLLRTRLWAADDKPTFQTFEYATLRWAGKENTHLIRPNGQVELLGPILSRIKRPDRTDERALLMNIAMNAVAREGYELASMTDDIIVMKRAVGR
jgi:hypothetical protein